MKWALLVGGRVGRQQAAAHAGWTRCGFRARRVRRDPRKARSVIERVVVVSVAGARIDRLFTAAARRRTGVSPEFFASKRRAAGVTTLYAEPWRLGADRLAAAIGAHRLSRATRGLRHRSRHRADAGSRGRAWPASRRRHRAGACAHEGQPAHENQRHPPSRARRVCRWWFLRPQHAAPRSSRDRDTRLPPVIDRAVVEARRPARDARRWCCSLAVARRRFVP